MDHASVTQDVADYTAPPAEEDAPTWDGNSPVYQWNEEFGDVGPKFPKLELELFGDPAIRQERTGLDFARIDQIEVLQERPVRIDTVRTFKDAGLHPVMLDNIELFGFDSPTPIQKYTIPSMLKGHDVIGIAQTGSGKTAAYLIPILSKLMGKAKKIAAPRPNPATYDATNSPRYVAGPLVLVVAPTRELAVQIFNDTRRLCYRSMLRPAVVYGGASVREQRENLALGCDILIGTPGRLIDFMSQPDVLALRRLRFVIDEADEMLDSDWGDDIRQILTGGEQDEGSIVYGLFSATFPKEARDLARDYLSTSHVRFRVGHAGSTTKNIRHIVIQAERDEKRDELVGLLNQLHSVRTLVFVNSRQEVDNLDDFLFNTGIPVMPLHSDRTQMEREAVLRAFRSGKAPVLVATGVMARGIDVRNVMHVVNYDLPSMDYGGIEEYTHRIGRTGRMGHRGIATSFFSERDEPIASVLTRTLLETKQEIPDFLQLHVPQGAAAEKPKFETESDFDPADLGTTADLGDVGGGGSWGANGGEASEAQTDSFGGAAWGAEGGDDSGGNTNGNESWVPAQPGAQTDTGGWA